MHARLTDPFNVASSPRQLRECQDKVSACMTRMFRRPENGGNPFLFALSCTKAHRMVRRLGSQEIRTAATNGKEFFWNPEFLESLSPEEVGVVMAHEAYHVLFFHCHPERSGGLDSEVWNIAVDYVVNATIETERSRSGVSGPVWTGPLGSPIRLDQYIDWVGGKLSDLPSPGCFADITVYGRSPESVYEQIRKSMLASPRRCKDCSAMSLDPKTGLSVVPRPWNPRSCLSCGAESAASYGPGSLDSHMAPSQTRDETLGDMMQAAEQANSICRGSTPGAIEDVLGRLQNPELSARDIIRMAVAQRAQKSGILNDYRRFRRRPSYIWERDSAGEMVPKHQVFCPKRLDVRAQISVMVDTSGSMSADDIATGVKELQSVCDVADIHVTPCDAEPYWNQTVRIGHKSDLQHIQVLGRGGTSFTRYFAELPKQSWYRGTDLVVIITDGDCGEYPKSLMPRNADLLWLVTNKREFRPSGGRVVNLRPTRR